MNETKQTDQRPFTPIVQRLRAAGLRPTSQRLYLARLLFEQGDRGRLAQRDRRRRRGGAPGLYGGQNQHLLCRP